MEQQKVDRAPAARCYRCGVTEIVSLCHHCGKPMCKEHSPLAFTEGTGAPLSREFGWLKLKESNPFQAAVYHCEEHEHRIAFFSGEAKKAARDLGSQPRLPLFPQVNTIDVVERLAGEVSFDGQDYRSTITSPATGEIVIDMSLNDADKALSLYRDEFRKPKFRLPEDLPDRAHGRLRDDQRQRQPHLLRGAGASSARRARAVSERAVGRRAPAARAPSRLGHRANGGSRPATGGRGPVAQGDPAVDRPVHHPVLRPQDARDRPALESA